MWLLFCNIAWATICMYLRLPFQIGVAIISSYKFINILNKYTLSCNFMVRLLKPVGQLTQKRINSLKTQLTKKNSPKSWPTHPNILFESSEFWNCYRKSCFWYIHLTYQIMSLRSKQSIIYSNWAHVPIFSRCAHTFL